MVVCGKLQDFYTVEEEIGRGGQAIVSKVSRRCDSKAFACKTFRVSAYRDEEDADWGLPDGGLAKEAEREIRALARLQQVEGCVHLVQVVRDADYCHLIMDLCECSLQKKIQEKKRLTEDEAAVVIKKVAKALRAMHEQGVVHRDIKLENILLGSRDDMSSVKVADFGVSSVLENGLHRMRLTGHCGTKRYMAPEISRQLFYDERVDAWGLGLVLYEILTGSLAFSSLASSKVAQTCNLLAEKGPESLLHWRSVSMDAKKLVLRLLVVDPDKRMTLMEVDNDPWIVRHSMVRGHEEKTGAEPTFRPVLHPFERGKWRLKRKRVGGAESMSRLVVRLRCH